MKCVSGWVVLTNAHSSLENAGMSLAGVKVLKAKWKTGMAKVNGEKLTGTGVELNTSNMH